MRNFDSSDKKSAAEWLAVLALFWSYLLTLCPTVYVGDAGELVTAAGGLGVAHPPGYPLFCLWQKCAMVLLPMGNLAWRSNVGTAVSALLAIWCLARLVTRRFLDLPVGASGACLLLLGWSTVLWSQSVITEVYALNLVFFAVFLLGVSSSKSASLYWTAGWLAMGIANHHTMILVAVSWIGWLAFQPKPSGRWVSWGMIGLIFGVLSAFYVYVPLRSLTNPLVDWGNPETFEKVLNHISRRQYAAAGTFPRSWSLTWDQLSCLGRLFLNQIPWGWSFLTVFGFFWCWRVARRLFWWGILLSFVIVGFVIGMTNFVPTPRQIDLIKVFLIPAYCGWILLIFLGAAAIHRRSALAGWTCWVAMPLTAWWGNVAVNDLSRQDLVYRYTQNVLNTLEPDAVLFAAGDNISFSLGVTCVEGIRRDVTFYDRFGNMFVYLYGEEWMDRHQRDLRRVEVEQRIIEASSGSVYYATMEVSPRLPVPLHLSGVIRRVEGRGYPESSDRLWRRYHTALPDPMPEPEVFMQHLRAQYGYCQGVREFERGDTSAAKKYLAQAVREAVWVDPLLINLGYLYSGKGLYAEAVEVFQKAVEVNPWSMEAYIGLGSTWGTRGQLDKAVQAFLQALEKQPTSAEARNALGIAYVKLERLDQAIDIFEENLVLNPHYPESYNEVGLAYAMLSDRARSAGRTQEARQFLLRAEERWERGLVVAPHHRNAGANLQQAKKLLSELPTP